MIEVEAVARAICDASPVFKSGWDEQTPVEKAIWMGVARAAIAALDACRSDTVVLHPTAPQLRQALEMVGADRAAMERRLETALREGREAGLREAAAVVEVEGKDVGGGCQPAFDPERLRAGKDPQVKMCLARKELAAAILALIDAGKTPGPSQPEPGAALSPGHEGA